MGVVGDFTADTEVNGGNRRYRAKLSRDWEIWGPNGGYVAAIALRDAVAPIAYDGLIHGRAAIWSPDGRLLASGGSQLLCRPTAR